MNNVELWTKALEIITNEKERIEVSKLIGQIIDSSVERSSLQQAVDDIARTYEKADERWNGVVGSGEVFGCIERHTGVSPTPA